MEEPLYRPPVPSPHPLAEPLDSSGLELTPEKSKRSRRLQLARNETAAGRGPLEKSGQRLIRPEASGPAAVTPPELSAPALNSTTRLQHQIHSLKQQRQRAKRHDHHHLQDSSSAASAADSVESVAAQRPLKEVNVPRHVSRYSNLVSVDVSEESFQKLTAQPIARRKEHPTSRPGSGHPDEPNIMDFFTPDQEWEEAEWNVNRTPARLELEPVQVPSDAPFSLYQLMQAWQ